jgi:hypothetical protein
MKKPTEYQKHRGGKKDVGRPTKKSFGKATFRFSLAIKFY